MMMASTAKTYRLLGVVVFLAVTFPFVKYAWVETWDYVGGDFEIFLRAASNLAHGDSPYPPEVLGKAPGEAIGEAWGNYIYPPIFARLLLPVSYLPAVWGKKIYLVVCMILYLAMLWPSAHRGYLCIGQRWVAFAILLGWGPVIHTFRHGQSDFIPLFLTILAWWSLEGTMRDSSGEIAPVGNRRILIRHRDLIAGVFLGIGSMVKITPILMLPVFVVGFRWRLVLGFVVGAISGLLISGPISSWQYFTQVLPNMADFAGMRQCPSIHIILVRTFDNLPVPATWDTWWPTVSELAGVAVTGILYVWILWYLFCRRNRISTADLLLLACFLPPLFAGEVKHHYALAIIPVLEAYRRLIPLCGFRPPLGLEADLSQQTQTQRENWWAIWRSGKTPRQRLLALTVCLLPNFYYWVLVNIPIELLSPVDPSTLLVLGNIGAALLILPLFMGDPLRESEIRNGTPPQA